MKYSDVALVVDCRTENLLESDFYTLNIWGKPCFLYVCEMIERFGECKKYLLTDANKIASKQHSDSIEIIDSLSRIKEDTVALISGTAIFLKQTTLLMCIEKFVGGVQITEYKNFEYSDIGASINPYQCRSISKALCIYNKTDDKERTTIELDAQEAMTVDSRNAFELAIVLMKKELNKPLLLRAIRERIEEKKDILTAPNDIATICFIGHSQIDNWEIKSLSGLKVQNCGIRGISSFEYTEYILDKNYIQCNADKYVIMHGTNDIVTDKSDEEIMESISKTFDYICKRRQNAKLFFLECAHVNGRLDRNNRRIVEFNKKLKAHMAPSVEYISLEDLNDEYGDLRSEYTKDGLHFSDEGYGKLRKILEAKI